jgi:hypothetical protein
MNLHCILSPDKGKLSRSTKDPLAPRELFFRNSSKENFPMAYITDAEERAIVQAKSKLDRIKEEGEHVAKTALELGAGLGVGALYGFLNTQKGGTAAAPFSIAGKVPLDTALAVAGVAGALLLKKTHKARPAILGAASGALAIYGSRMGAAWEAARMGAATGTTTQTTSGLVGHGIHSRQFGPAGSRHRAAAHFVHAYAGR